MKRKLLIVVSGSVLALTACNKDDEVTTNAADSNVVIDNGAVGNTADAGPLASQSFANAAAASDRFEIESSKLAASAGTSPAIKSFAAKMVTAHTASTAKLKSTAGSLNLTPDDTLSPDQQQKLDSLKALHGTDFDSAYAAAQVEAHQKALDTLNGYAASGDNAKLKELASGMVPTVTAHLNMAKGLK
jgi:putative membrane protein